MADQEEFDPAAFAPGNQPLPSNFDPEEAQNLEDIERQFAVKAVQQMQTYWSLLEKIRGSTLRLTKLDDEIVAHLEKDFPELDVSKPVNEDEMKSPRGKQRWRDFMMTYEKTITDYNFGTLVRTAPNVEYGEKETIFVPRMQFYALEIARNRRGLNDWIYEKEHPTEKKP